MQANSSTTTSLNHGEEEFDACTAGITLSLDGSGEIIMPEFCREKSLAWMADMVNFDQQVLLEWHFTQVFKVICISYGFRSLPYMIDLNNLCDLVIQSEVKLCK